MHTTSYTTNGLSIRNSKLLVLFLLIFSWCILQAKAQQTSAWKLNDLQREMMRTDSPVILNFWATFCQPCIKELPHFQALANRYRTQGVRLVLVSLDLKEAYPQKIAAFKRKLKLTSTVVYLNESNADVFCPAVDSSWSGVIPATLFFNPQTGYRKFYEEELTFDKIEAEIKAMLKPKNY